MPPEPEFEVQDCVRRTVAGDQFAAHALIMHLQPLVFRWVRNHLPQRQSEQDLVQEVFLKLLKKLPNYQPRAGVPFEHWVSRLAVRTCLDALRAEKARPELRMADLNLDEGQGLWLHYLMSDAPDAGLPDATEMDAKTLVHVLLMQLSPADRLVLTLMDLEEKSSLEISQLTGWTRPMVKMRAMRARRKLRQLADKLKLNE